MNSNGDIVPMEQAEPGAVPVPAKWEPLLRDLNRRGRRAWYAEKRAGHSDVEAICAAQNAHCGGGQ